MKKDLKSYTLPHLRELIVEQNGKKFHADYIFNFVHEKHHCKLEDITPVPAKLRNKLLDEGFFISSLEILKKQKDPDGTEKFLFSARDGSKFESVVLDDNGRKTVCISSQAGCRMGCDFCATAGIGFKRNLSSGEIAEQVYAAKRIAEKISNVVFMGMGEPFDNYENAVNAAFILNESKGLGLGARHITLSTCGLISKIEDFSQLDKQFRLAVSIHAGCDETRNKLMPINQTNPLDKLFETIENYCRKTGRRVTLEYCLIDGLNDSREEAVKFLKSAQRLKCNVNLIEFNPAGNLGFAPPKTKKTNAFADILREKGIETHIRYRRGRNIKAACGELGAELEKNK
ncbi:putative dual-specificity RNA methyltransferase RlmN [Sedimentisphaera cyanobacteriorum]|uniref:Probable dual-specificity RNA methyltransferase RlmN n=1 Tax=Sedimentisphaera cyanobacteriorum TaxID=1940790 RepID=A0A1Q2HSX0_9BACT|nr:23S rRNA (adenine(2503)-C(2))-methyltransferase RlmN [Sedimentisphaera cyanobacteriorum]AQQ10376.1 putative dual-specificity RNA methyltransferase RlmN [Sedimentisphaera cyanobacteriorum]